jgi:hypothetical protein
MIEPYEVQSRVQWLFTRELGMQTETGIQMTSDRALHILVLILMLQYATSPCLHLIFENVV